MEKISFIVPCYNEGESVEELYNEIIKTFKRNRIKLEIIFVNDGSKDNTDYKIKKLLSNNDNIVYINFSRNFGKEAAMYAGLKQATGDYTTIIDADLQQHPKVVKQMYEILKKNKKLDCVATYQKKRKEGIIKKILSKCFYKLANKLVTINMADNASDFRLFKNEVKEALLSFTEHKRFTKGIFSWVGFNVEYIEYEPLDRQFGTSKWKLKSLFSYAFDGILSYSEKILYIPLKFGIFSIFISIGLLVLAILNKIDYIYSIITFISSINFIMIGLIAIYLSRIYVEVQNRPIFIAKEIIYSKEKKKNEKNNKK